MTVVDVKDYGAKGDGRTDDTAAVQRAYDAARGGPIEWPPGVYRVTETTETDKDER